MNTEDILHNITYIKSRSGSELKNVITSIIGNDYEIIKIADYLDSFKLTISLNNNNFDVIVHVKRVHDNGFPNKRRPEIKRIQIRPIREEIYTDSKQCFLLSGIVYYCGEPVMVVWNPTSFRGFATNRSAYISASSIKMGYDYGFYCGSDCGTNIYVCKKGYFKDLLVKYINDTKFEEIVW